MGCRPSQPRGPARRVAARSRRDKDSTAPDKQPRRQPKRQALPADLPSVDQRVEPEDTNCPMPKCRQPMMRVGEDINERLDIIPAQFFVQRQIRGKWDCRCCQLLVQEPAAPQVFDNALPIPGVRSGFARRPRRRDADRAARPRRGQDQTSLHVGLRSWRFRVRAGRGVRLLCRARRPIPVRGP